MAVERRNPLPAGVYWQDFFTPPAGPSGGAIADFLAWRASNSASVKVLKTRETATDRGQQLWALFEVSAPVPWDAVRFGFPTVAPKGASTSETDVIQRPDPEPDVAAQLAEALSPRSVYGLAIVAVAAVAAVAALRLLPGRK